MRHNAVDDNVACTAIAATISTAPDHLAIVIGIKVLNIHRSEAVELDNLVRGVECTSTIDV